MPKPPRLDTKLESDAAEFLVLGRLLLERVPTYKSYVNYPGYDFIAVNPELNTSARHHRAPVRAGRGAAKAQRAAA